MYEKITLSNGVRILTEHVKDVRSASFGIWVGAGSRHEPAAKTGISHFIEHMVFKGTKRRSAAGLAAFIDSAGGQVDAYTSKEITCYHGRVVDTRLGELCEVLGDMLLDSVFSEECVHSERNVILEEIGMYEDNPEDIATEALFRRMYPGSLGRPILGTPGVLSRITPAALKRYMAERYRGGAIVAAIAGNFSEADVARAAEILSRFPSGGKNTFEPAFYTPAVSLRRKECEQNHLNLAFPAVPIDDERRYTIQLMTDILGGGVSSRLFQKIREERGLCYSIYSQTSLFSGAGVLYICTALNADAEGGMLSLLSDEIKRFRDEGVTEEELERAREQTRANILMSLESTSARMNRLGRGELLLNKILSPADLIERFNAVTREDISNLAAEVFDFEKISLSIVGKIKPQSYYLRNVR